MMINEKLSYQRNSSLPRVVSVDIKNSYRSTTAYRNNDVSLLNVKPYMAGELEVIKQTCRSKRFGEIRGGSLMLYNIENGRKTLDVRIPLRNLNLRIDPKWGLNRFSLSKRGESAPLATFQVPDDQDSVRWLKNLAMQIIINTPLNAVKFCDVLSVAEAIKKHQNSGKNKSSGRAATIVDTTRCNRILYSSQCDNNGGTADCDTKKPIEQNNNDVKFQHPLIRNREAKNQFSPSSDEDEQSAENVSAAPESPDCAKRCSQVPVANGTDCSQIPVANGTDCSPENDNDFAQYHSMPTFHRDRNYNRLRAPSSFQRESREHLLADLLTKCQRNDQYVSVTEKRILFESLSRFSFSVDNLIRATSSPRASTSGSEPTNSTSVKYHSLHDLNNAVATSVKDMCRYFETIGPPSAGSSLIRSRPSEQIQ